MEPPSYRRFFVPYPDNLRKTRFQFCRGGRLQFRVGMPGIVCVGAPAEPGWPGLVLVWDEGAENLGTSATNGIADILAWLQAQWGQNFLGSETVVVERDSEGQFDHAYVRWQGTALPEVAWKPVKWPQTDPRSELAFHGLFGWRAKALTVAARAYTGSGG